MFVGLTTKDGRPNNMIKILDYVIIIGKLTNYEIALFLYTFEGNWGHTSERAPYYTACILFLSTISLCSIYVPPTKNTIK